MERAYFVCLFLSLTSTLLLAQSNPVPLPQSQRRGRAADQCRSTDPKAHAGILESYGKLPLSFEANQGQADGRVRFLSRTGAYTLFLTGDEAVLALRGKKTDTKAKTARGVHALQSLSATKAGGVIRMKLRNANPAAKVTGVDELPGTSNYFIGNDPAKWRAGVPTYARVKYEGIYPGIDLVYYGNRQQLEYDFIVAPGANAHRIAFDVLGARLTRQNARGDLVLKVGGREISWHKPVVYQEKDGARQAIAAHYTITGANRVGFELATYDASRPLYIDPLIYSTYLGGSSGDFGEGIAVDSAGNAYVAGYTSSTDFPTTSGVFQTACTGCGQESFDAFVSKLNASGSALGYSTYLGGSSIDSGQGIAVDGAGNAYVTGYTLSKDFPTTLGGFQTSFGGKGNAFVTELNSTGSALLYSTYLGGSGGDSGYGIAVDSVGDAYITGPTSSGDFPVTPGAFQTVYPGNGAWSVFVAKLNPTGSALAFSTYLGGREQDISLGLAVDSLGDAYVTGQAYSTNFPVTAGAFQTACGSCNPNHYRYGNAFVSKFNASGSALVYSTYLGGKNSDAGYGIAIDSAGNAYVTGTTASKNFPVTSGTFQATESGDSDAFVTKMNPTGSALVYSTYLGGTGGDHAYSIALDTLGNAYVTGQTYSTNFPVTPGAFQLACGSKPVCSKYGDAFVTEISASGSALVYSTYLGGSGVGGGNGIVVGSPGNAYVAGYTASTDFPVTSGAFQTTYGGGQDAFVTKIHLVAGVIATSTTLASSPNPSSSGQEATFTAMVSSSTGAPPDGTVTFIKGKTVLGTGTLSGGSASFTTSALPVGTNSITAVYGGDSNFGGSTSKAVKQVVDKATTTTALASSLNPSNVGQSVTFTATESPQYGGIPTGSIVFKDGTTLLKTVALSGGVAKYTTSTLTSGKHSITATYNGSTSFDGSSGSLTQTIN